MSSPLATILRSIAPEQGPRPAASTAMRHSGAAHPRPCDPDRPVPSASWPTERRRNAGVEGVHFHDLRREFASRLLESPGVALHDVAQWVGHASVVTTTRYLATTGVRQREVLKRFERHRKVDPGESGLGNDRLSGSQGQDIH